MNFDALIFGKNGRFARNLASRMNDSKCVSYKEFMLENSGFNPERVKVKNGFWTFGSGNKFDSDPQSEIKALEKLLYLLQSKQIVIANFVYLSSGGTVYGKQIDSVSEESPLHPVGRYAETKFQCEELIKNKFLKYVESVQILRLANAYNLEKTNNNPQGLIEKLFESSVCKEPIQIQVNGNSRRQYGSHSDYSKIILNVSQMPLSERGGKFELLNIYPPFQLSINDIIVEMAQTLNVKSESLATFDYANNDLDSLILTSNQESKWQILSAWSSLSQNISLAQS